MAIVRNGIHAGRITAPRSKSHEHRLLIADFLAGDDSRLVASEGDSADIVATKRCLMALRTNDPTPVLDCGESGSTRRFMAPIAAALGKRPEFKTAGRLGSRPMLEYGSLAPGEFRLEGNVSSQFVTGLLFALPLLKGDSRIRFNSPLESRGYVDMTLKVLAGAGIAIRENGDGFDVPGGQRYQAQPKVAVEGDWSGAAFWFGMNALGSEVVVDGLDRDSAQPDRVICDYIERIVQSAASGVTLDVSVCPDIFPVLSVVAAGFPRTTTFVGTRRLRIKESDRTAAMADVLLRFGVKVKAEENSFIVYGIDHPFASGEFSSFGDHRIAMSIAVGATHAAAPVEIDDVDCAAKSYPYFFKLFNKNVKIH